MRVDYEIESIEKIKYMEEMHQNNIQNLETGFQAQIMEMVDSYQQLVRDRFVILSENSMFSMWF